MNTQRIMTASGNYQQLTDCLKDNGVKRLFLVCDNSLPFLRISAYFDTLKGREGIKVTRFSDFKPNPQYESVVKGVEAFLQSESDAIMAVGGGSAMDVAKCIKLYANMDHSRNYLKQTIVPNDIPLIAIPTTAGTGSEATRFAVIYYEGEKQSVSDWSIIPGFVLMDANALRTLPLYQKKATMLDALCHAIESFWSVNSTEESRQYSAKAIGLVLENYKGYLEGDEAQCAGMLKAAYTAGQAINLTQTTAGHAMCYKLTSLYGAAHGHAAALCVSKLWQWMLCHTDRCIDPRGEQHLLEVFDDIADAMGVDSAEQAADEFTQIVASMGFEKLRVQVADFEVLIHSVNPVRLKNHPIVLDEAAIAELYHQILD